MTCTTEGCDNPVENRNTGLCASCGQALRKAERQAKAAYDKRQRAIEQAKVRKPKEPILKQDSKKRKNLYECSDGTKVTQEEIDRRRSESYRQKYPSQNMPCAGCGNSMAHGSAHIIPQSRLKKLHKTELIWHPDLFFPGCVECNAAIENPKGEEWKSLLNINECLTVIKTHDLELFQKFMNNTR